MSLITKAANFAKKAHASINQKRKYTGEPYEVHPARVAQIVATVSDDEEMIAAAWLHDVLEDVAPYLSDFNDQAILREFGPAVLQLVLELTEVSKEGQGNRKQRKLLDRLRLSQASKRAKTVKLADLIDNISDLSENDPSFAIVFREEVKKMLPYLATGSQQLYQQLKCLLNNKNISS